MDASPLVILIIVIWAFVALGLVGLIGFRAWLILSGFHRTSKEGVVVLLVTLPKFRDEEEAEKTTTKEQKNDAIGVAETFFSSIGGLKPQKGFLAWLLGRNDHFSFEIVSHEGLIKFYVATPRKLVGTIEQQLLAQHPDAHIEEIDDYNIFSPTGTILGAYLQFARPVGFPIKTYEEMESDPLDAITNTLSKLGNGESAAIQYIVRSARPTWREAGMAVAKRMQSGMSLDEALSGGKKGKNQALDVFRSEKKVEERKGERDRYRLSPQEDEVVKRLEGKASKSGMDANIRLIVSTHSADRSEVVMNNIFNAFSQYNIYE